MSARKLAPQFPLADLFPLTGDELSNSLAEHAAEIWALRSRIVSDVAEIGRRLVEVKRIVGHGNWLPWLDREFGWSEDTAERFIRVHEFIEGLSNSASVRNLVLTLPVSSVYLLAAPSTPDEARDAIIERAEAGETVSVADVKQTIEEVRRGIVTGVAMTPQAERGLDLYETPSPAIEALLRAEPLPPDLWEPACGPGAIVRVLRAHGHRVIGSDVADYGDPTHFYGRDFLMEQKAPDGCGCIITNPPFMHANNFVRHAVTLAPRVIMLLRLAFLEGTGRSDILDGGTLARVYVFRNRLPMMHRNVWQGQQASSAMAFAWFVWDANHQGRTELRRISWEAEADDAAEEADAMMS